MSTSTASERTPLLVDADGARQPPEAETESFEEVQARAEAIREALPMGMVIPSLIAVFSGLFIAAIDSTLVVALIGSISSSFQAADRVFWLSSAYLLTMCAFAPIWGRLSDVVGRKVCMIWAVVLFGVGTLLCTVSPSMDALIFARGVQGIGAAGIQPSTAIVINDLIPMRSRGIYQAIAQLVFSMGYALGGPVGGFLNDTFGWRFAFTIQIPPILLALLLLSLFLELPDLPKTAEERAKKAQFEGKSLRTVLWSRLDPLGTLLLVTSVVTMLLSLSALSAYDLDWSDSRVWGGLLTAGLLLIAFLFVEIRISSEPLVPLRILRQRSLASIWIIYFVLSFTGAILFYFPFYFLVILQQTSTQVGLHYLPVSVATMTGSFVAGVILRRSGRYRYLSIALSILSIATPAYLATWTDTNRPSALGQNVALLPCAFGGASLNTLLLVALMAIAGQQDAASAVSLLYFFRALGSITGTSTLGSVIQKVLIVELGKRIHGPYAPETINIIRKDLGRIATLPEAQQQAARESYSVALRIFHIIITALTVLVALFVLLVQERNLNSAKTSAATKNSTSGGESGARTSADGLVERDIADEREEQAAAAE